MLNEITKLTTKQILEAAADGENITIIVNGQYYDLDTTAGTDPEQAFLNGVKFAAATLEDRRARMDMSFRAIDERNPKTTKRAIAINQAKNAELKSQIEFLEYITEKTHGFKNWLEDFNRGKLWKL